MEEKNYIIIILTICIISLVLYLAFFNRVDIEIKDSREKPLYEQVIKRFADTHDYNITTYNCVNYSEDLGFILNNLGYKTEQLTIRNETSAHRRIVLVLEIEPQTSEIIVK